MSMPVPLSLFHTGRAQCPDCGSPLPLTDQHALVTCHYCGGTAVVERRLRMLEPILDAFITVDAPVNESRKYRASSAINAIAQDESHCPTCGSLLETTDPQAIQKCPHCRTESKIERRLVRREDANDELAEMECNDADFDPRRTALTESLLRRLEKHGDLQPGGLLLGSGRSR